jgi:ferredoxin
MRIDLRLLSLLSARPRTISVGGPDSIRRALRDEPWSEALPAFEPTGEVAAKTSHAASVRWSSLGSGVSPGGHVVINLLDPYPRVRLLPAWAASNTAAFRAGVDRLLSTGPTRVSVVFDQRLPASWRARSIDELPRKVERLPLRWRYPLGCAALLASQLNADGVVDAIDLVNHDTIPVACVGAAVSYHLLASGTPMRSLVPAGSSGLLGHPMREIDVGDEVADRAGECVVWLKPGGPVTSAARCTECGWCAEICPTACTPAKLVDEILAGNRTASIRFGLDACVDCGLCSAVCPSGLSLHPVIRRPERA